MSQLQSAPNHPSPGQGTKEHNYTESEVLITQGQPPSQRSTPTLPSPQGSLPSQPPPQGSPPTLPSAQGTPPTIPSSQGSPPSQLPTEMHTRLPSSNGTTDPEHHIQSDDLDHTHLDSDDEELLETSTTKDEVAQLLRTTVEELEVALEESRKILAERDEELVRLRTELDRYRQQAAREIANKTKLAQSLDESHSHAQELEELLQKWQLELRESKMHTERLQASLQQEHQRCESIETQLSNTLLEKDKEIEQIKSQLVDARQKLNHQDPSRRISTSFATAEDSNPGPEGVDKMQLHFLKQAVYHLLTDFHAEDQLRAILSILDFSAQERKAVYAKVEEKKKHSRGLYM